MGKLPFIGLSKQSVLIHGNLIFFCKYFDNILEFLLVRCAKVDGNTKKVNYNTGAETLPMYDIGDTYVTNPAFWAVINAHN